MGVDRICCDAARASRAFVRGASLAMLVAFAAAGPTATAQSSYATWEVARRALPRAFVAEAVVEAVRQSTLASQVAGRVTELRVKVGDVVRAGEPIARIDARAADDVVAASVAHVSEANANLVNASQAYERARSLAAQKFVSQAAVDQAEAAYRAAKARVDGLSASAAQAATQRSYTTIAAPFDGVVGATHVEAGELATPGREIVTLFEPRSLRVTATLPQSVLAQWHRDRPVVVELSAQRQVIVATRATIVPLADARTHTVKVRLDLPAGTHLLPGQSARVSFPTGSIDALAVPQSAIVRRGEVTAVYVVDDHGRTRLRQVRTGEASIDASAAWIEILAGLKAGERIALNPIAAGLQGAPQH